MSIQIEKYNLNKVHKNTIIGLRHSSTGEFLFSADQSGEVVVWQRKNQRPKQRVRSPHAQLTGIWLSEDEKWLLLGHQWGHLVVYSLPELNLKTNIQLKTERPDGYVLPGTSKPVLDYMILAVCPSKDSNFYAALEYRDFFSIQRNTMQVASYIHVSGPLIECSVSSLNGQFIFFGDDLGYIYRLSLPEMGLEAFSVHHEQVPAFDSAMRFTVKEGSMGIAGLALSHDAKLLASTSRAGGVQIWQTETRRKDDAPIYEFRPLAARKPIRNEWLRGVCFMPNSTELILGADDGIVEVWDYHHDHVSSIAKCPESVRSIDISPDGSQLAIGCDDGSIFLIPGHVIFSNEIEKDKLACSPNEEMYEKIEKTHWFQERFPFPGIGVVFDIEGLGDSWYGCQAWRFFMKHINPKRIPACILVEGDTSMTLKGEANEFCIGIYGSNLDLSYIRETFEGLDDPVLRPFHRRFIEKIALDNQPLPIKGHIDASGRLVTDNWNETDHILCMENSWSYYPRNVPSDLDPNHRKELEQLKVLKFEIE